MDFSFILFLSCISTIVKFCLNCKYNIFWITVVAMRKKITSKLYNTYDLLVKSFIFKIFVLTSSLSFLSSPPPPYYTPPADCIFRLR